MLKLTEKEIHTILVDNDNRFKPQLSKSINIRTYSKKIALRAKFIIESHKNERVSFIAYYVNNDFYYITMVLIDKQNEGKGFLKKMLMQIKLENINNRKIQLEVNKLNTKAISAYKKLEFKIAETRKDTYILEL